MTDCVMSAVDSPHWQSLTAMVAGCNLHGVRQELGLQQAACQAVTDAHAQGPNIMGWCTYPGTCCMLVELSFQCRDGMCNKPCALCWALHCVHMQHHWCNNRSCTAAQC